MNVFIGAATLFVSVLAMLGSAIRSIPIPPDAYGDLAQHAVAVKFGSSCNKRPSIWDRVLAEAAYKFIAETTTAYSSYRESGKSLLHLAVGNVKCKQTDIRFPLESKRAMRAIDLALSRGENINEYNVLGVTALHTAALSGNQNIVQYLLSRGASHELESRGSFLSEKGKTPLDLAVMIHEMNPSLGHSEVIRVLEENQP